MRPRLHGRSRETAITRAPGEAAEEQRSGGRIERGSAFHGRSLRFSPGGGAPAAERFGPDPLSVGDQGGIRWTGADGWSRAPEPVGGAGLPGASASTHCRMLIARAITSVATIKEVAASTIISSLAHGLIAETSVGLNAVAVQKDSDR